MGKKELSIDNGNGKNEPKDSDAAPLILVSGGAEQLVQKLREEARTQEKTVDLSKYAVMEGMQNYDKVDFFTEFVNDDDVLRMNTIEMFVKVSPYTIRKTSAKNREKINSLLKEVYVAHVQTHKRNMVSKSRKREDAYTRILASESSDSGVVPTGIRKFFGIGGKK